MSINHKLRLDLPKEFKAMTTSQQFRYNFNYLLEGTGVKDFYFVCFFRWGCYPSALIVTFHAWGEVKLLIKMSKKDLWL